MNYSLPGILISVTSFMFRFLISRLAASIYLIDIKHLRIPPYWIMNQRFWIWCSKSYILYHSGRLGHFVSSFISFKQPTWKNNKETRQAHCTFRIEYEIYWNEAEKKICCIVNIRRPTHVTRKYDKENGVSY